MSENDAARLCVVGAGGIGGIVAAHLTYLGCDVTVLTRNEVIADAINHHGFRVRGESAIGTVPGVALSELGKRVAPFDYVLLATQPPQVEEAARTALPHLKEDGAMVCFQNGLCEPRVAAIAGEGRVIGGIVAWGASMIEPGVYDRTSAGGFTLGRPFSAGGGGVVDERVAQLGWLLEAIGPVTLTDNLMGARWSKLALNCAISSLGTIAGDRLGAVMKKRFVRRLALEIMTETVEVARAEGMHLEKVAGTLDLEWIALTADEKHAKLGSPALFAKHALLLAVGTRYRRLRSSMLNAIERGRTPAVDFLNGEVVDRGAKHGIATPVNAACRDEVWRIARGKARPSHALLEELFARTRREPREATPASVAPADDAPAPVSKSAASVPATSAPATSTDAAEPSDAPPAAAAPPDQQTVPIE
jgi:2-dehydropantoate 2-reductase